MNAFFLLAVLSIFAATLIIARPLSDLSYPSLFPRGHYSSAPTGSLVVSKSPKADEYSTIQAAVNAVKAQGKGDHSIYINAGIFDEAVFIDEIQGSLTIIGATSKTGSYIDNQVTITHGNSQRNKASNDESATLRVLIDDFKMYYINVINSFGEGAQAVALSAKGSRQAYYGCLFGGFQDQFYPVTVHSFSPNAL
jgi:pectinesterase